MRNLGTIVNPGGVGGSGALEFEFSPFEKVDDENAVLLDREAKKGTVAFFYG